ncbi:MAG: SGNH/GDSL hydrolase family protein [Clostridia bacterium]|nr:SGNH/GDSL hydrolase family protein [Clostridia bacterium]
MSFMREYAEWNDFWWEKAGDYGRRRVLLIGDSITRSYRDRVQMHLKPSGIAVDKLCGSRCAGDPMLEAELDLMTGSVNGYRYDVIHFNNGLHGVCNDTLIPIETYRKGICNIIEILRRNQPNAKIVVATSTPISPRDTHDILLLGKDNDTVVERNAFLRELANQEGLILDDLYALTVGNLSFPKSDYVHFRREAAEAIGDRVAEIVTALLA